MQVLVIADIDEDHPLEKYNFPRGRVHYLRGNSSLYDILAKSNLEKSYSCIIVADNKTVARGNLRSIFTTVAVRSRLKHHKKQHHYKLIGELYFRENKDYFIEAGIFKLASIEDLRIRLIAHSCLNPGISNMLIHMLSFNSSHKLDLISFKEAGIKQETATFTEIAQSLRNKSISLIAAYNKEKSNTQPLELDFKEHNSPYVISPIDGADMSINSQCKLLVAIDSHKNLSLKKHPQFFIPKKSTHFNHTSEKLLVIGDLEISTPIINILNSYCPAIIHLVITHSKATGGSLHCEKIDMDFANSNCTKLLGVTRVLIITHKTEQQGSDRNIYQDDQTMLIAKGIKHIYKHCTAILNPNIHILAEIKNADNINLFHDIGISQPVATNLFIDRVLANMAFHGGLVSEFFIKCMGYEHNNKVRLVKLTAETIQQQYQEDINGKNYHELLDVLMPHRVQLMALEKYDSGEIIICPKIATIENDYKFDSKDSVYAFVAVN